MSASFGMEHRWRVRFRKEPQIYPEIPVQIETTELFAESKRDAEERVISFRRRNREGYDRVEIVDSELIL